MATDQKDVFGLGGLANPNYAVPQARTIERGFYAGGDAPRGMDEPEAPASEDELRKRFDEIEKNIGCRIFDRAQPAESDDNTPRASDDARSEARDPDFADRDGSARAPAPPASGNAREEGAPSRDAYPLGTPHRPIMMSAEGAHHTEEAFKRDKLTSALSALSIGTDGFLDADRERDHKLVAIEEIEDLRALFAEDGEDVSRIVVPTPDDSLETIESTRKILRRHNDRRRFGTLADECIMLAATSLETLCDGERDWLGFRPDLRGWSGHVRSKLRRMHHDTSQIASSVMNDYNIGPGMRLMLELVPNLIMFAHAKATKKAGASATSAGDDADFEGAVHRLRDK